MIVMLVQNLGSDVIWRSKLIVQELTLFPEYFCSRSKIDEPYLSSPLVKKHNVLRFDIPMDDIIFMQIIKRVEQLNHDIGDLALLPSPSLLFPLVDEMVQIPVFAKLLDYVNSFFVLEPLV